VSDGPTPIRKPKPKPTGHPCICGATWRPGFSSDPAWLITASRDWRHLDGVLFCQACGRDKLDVLREQAAAKHAATPPAIPPREPTPARVLPFRRPAPAHENRTEGERP
jgi:hypothetical protein